MRDPVRLPRMLFGIAMAMAMAMAMAIVPNSVRGASLAPRLACLPEAKSLSLTTPGVLTMSTNATLPPTQYVDESGNLQGMNIDFGNEIARRLCLAPRYVNVAFETQVPGLQNKRWDMINTGFYFTPDRAKLMQLIPYSVSALALVVSAGNPSAIATVGDLAGKAVGVEVGGIEEDDLQGLKTKQAAASKPIDIRVFDTYGDAFQALSVRQIDAVLAGAAVATYYKKQGRFDMVASGLFAGSPMAFATVDPKLATAIVAALSGMLADGTYDRLITQYGLSSIVTWSAYPGHIRFYYNP